MANLKDTRYYRIFVQVYRFFCEYINGSPAGSYTEDWIKNAEEQKEFIEMQYGGDPFVKDFCNACVSEMKRKYDYIKELEKEGRCIPDDLNAEVKYTRYWKDFQDFWLYFEKYYIQLSSIDATDYEANDKFWEASTKEAHDLGYRRNDPRLDRLMQELILATCSELERIDNKKRKAA